MNRRRLLLNTAKAFGAAALSQLYVPTAALADALKEPANINKTDQIGPFASLPWNRLKTKISGNLLLPTEAMYDFEKLGYQKRYTYAPKAVLKVSNETDILYAMQFCDENNIDFSIRGGGHSYEAWSSSSGLIIDLSKLKNFSFNSKTQFKVGAGWRLGELLNTQLKPRHLMIPTGSCPTVGLSGLTLGGGYGLSSRYLGLTCDQVSAFKMVTATGQVIRVSKYENTDLFWGLKGAGNGQLGLVTEFEMTATAVQKVSVVNLKFEARDWKALFDEWQSFAPAVTSKLTSIFTLGSQSGKLTLARISGLFWGSAKELETLMAPFLVNFKPSVSKIYDTDFYSSFADFAGGTTPKQSLFKSKSDYLYRNWTLAEMQNLENEISLARLPSLAILFDSYGGAISKKQRTDTAFVHRDAKIAIQYFASWNNMSENSKNEATLNDLYSNLRGQVSGESYVNYCDQDLLNPLEAYYGENLNRLKALKKKWDPQGIFTHPQSL